MGGIGSSERSVGGRSPRHTSTRLPSDKLWHSLLIMNLVHSATGRHSYMTGKVVSCKSPTWVKAHTWFTLSCYYVLVFAGRWEIVNKRDSMWKISSHIHVFYLVCVAIRVHYHVVDEMSCLMKNYHIHTNNNNQTDCMNIDTSKAIVRNLTVCLLIARMYLKTSFRNAVVWS